jgi:protein-L-isoaspartate(D-aspartate) O-methyltransferase
MSQLTSEQSQLEMMIQRQVVDRGITDERVLGALRSVPRERFFENAARNEAFADRAAPIGYGQTISQPYIVALMTERLEVAPEHTVLEIGTGSGYHTAVLAKLAKYVYSVERVKPLLDEAWERLMDLNIRNVSFRYADGTLGWPEKAPFDRIAAGAPEVPKGLLLGQLKDGGIAVFPVGPEDHQMLVAIHRRGDQLDSTDITPCRFVKLIGKGGWSEDEK